MLKVNRTNIIYRNRFREFISSNYYRRFNLVARELRVREPHAKELLEYGYKKHLRKPANSWDLDKFASAKLNHAMSWKAHYKARKSWAK